MDGARYSKEEFARRGEALYEERVRPNLVAEDEGKYVAIDVESGAYEVDRDGLAALDRLHSRRAEVQAWLRRVGRRHAFKFGYRSLGESR